MEVQAILWSVLPTDYSYLTYDNKMGVVAHQKRPNFNFKDSQWHGYKKSINIKSIPLLPTAIQAGYEVFLKNLTAPLSLCQRPETWDQLCRICDVVSLKNDNTLYQIEHSTEDRVRIRVPGQITTNYAALSNINYLNGFKIKTTPIARKNIKKSRKTTQAFDILKSMIGS